MAVRQYHVPYRATACESEEFMLLELAIGDAYGAGFEYVDAEVIRSRNDLSEYVRHPRHAIRPGCYTDDTQMSIAVAEALLSGEPWTPQLLAAHFVTAFKRDPRQGYAGRFYDFLQTVGDGEEFLTRIIPTSEKSGAAMRAAPIGVLPDRREVIRRCRVQAAITHNTPEGINAALAAALLAHYCSYQLGPKEAVGRFLEAQVPGAWADPWSGKVGSKGWMSVRAAITALMESESMSELLRRCIAFGGDVDTVATIALAAGSCSTEISQDLPDTLFWALENGPYGRDFLLDLDQRLLGLVRRPASVGE
jgi:ADP-ribosylglycohydrolase